MGARPICATEGPLQPMNREIVTQIIINAPAARVWQVLCDFEAYPQWNPSIRRLSGVFQEGERLSVILHLPGRPAMRLRPRVIRLLKEREFAWRGHFLMPALFAGEHEFLIEPLHEQRTQLVQRARFTGGAASLLWPLIKKDTRRGFLMMNAAIKGLIEDYKQD